MMMHCERGLLIWNTGRPKIRKPSNTQQANPATNRSKAPWKTAPEPLVREGGTVVVALDAYEGLGSHWLFGPGMCLDAKRAPRLRGRDVIFFSPHLDRSCLQPEVREHIVLFETWDATADWLRDKHGASARACVYPCATMQLGSGIPA